MIPAQIKTIWARRSFKRRPFIGAHTRSIFLVRTHQWNRRAQTLYKTLCKDVGASQVLVSFDTRINPLPVDVPCQAIDRQWVESMGLCAPENYGWRCGDYNWYRALDMPWKSLWLVEPDVRLVNLSYAELDAMFADNDADFIANRVVQAPPDWTWNERASRLADTIYLSFFPITRIRRSAAEALLVQRRRWSTIFRRNGLPTPEWPNDESFVATVIGNSPTMTYDQLSKRGIDCSLCRYRGVFTQADMDTLKGPALVHPVRL
ncbi:MAG: hypothetical protein AAF739_07270 [Pseudomonadota bacterium]